MSETGFSAFPEETLHFLAGIAFQNSKDWFEANRSLYEAGYVAPARKFVDNMGPRLRKVSADVRYEAKVNGSYELIDWWQDHAPLAWMRMVSPQDFER